jgi:hypothetical protein
VGAYFPDDGNRCGDSFILKYVLKFMHITLYGFKLKG